MIQSNLTSAQHLVDCANMYYKEHPNGIGFISALHDNYDNVDKTMLRGLSTERTEELNDLLKPLFPNEAQIYSIIWSDQYNEYRLLLKSGEPVQPPHPAQAVKPIIASIDALLDIAHKWYTSDSTQSFSYHIRSNYTTPEFIPLDSSHNNQVQITRVANALFADACDFDFKQEGLNFIKIPKVGKTPWPTVNETSKKPSIKNALHLADLANEWRQTPSKQNKVFIHWLRSVYDGLDDIQYVGSELVNTVQYISDILFPESKKDYKFQEDLCGRIIMSDIVINKDSVSDSALIPNKTKGAILNISHLVLLANQYITHPWNDNTDSTEEFSKFLEFTFVNYPKLVWPSLKMLDFIKCLANTMFEQEFKNTNIKWDDTKYSKGKLMVEFVEPVASIADTQFNMVVTQTTTRTVELSKDKIQDILSHAVFGASEEINEIIKVELHYDKDDGFSATVIGTSQKKV